VSFLPIPTFNARLFVDASNGPSDWTDTEAAADPANPKPIPISYFVLKRGGFVVLEYAFSLEQTDTAAIVASLPVDAIAIVSTKGAGGGARLNAWDNKNFTQLRMYSLERGSGAVVQGWVTDDVAFNDYTDVELPSRAVDQEVMSWTYVLTSLVEETNQRVLQADGGRELAGGAG
jgi:hypothetical protein